MGSIRFLFFTALVVFAQTPSRSFVGTVTGLKAEAGQLEIKPDGGAPIEVAVTPDTLLQRVEPGEKNLKNAQTLPFSAVAKGDRVLVTLMPGGTSARRIVVMPATDISKRDEANRQDWAKRGVSGIVSAKTESQITLRMRALGATKTFTVTVSGNTVFRRYAPDSVKFADAQPSNLDGVAVGDQLRARGQKNEDGSQVTAEEVVFGTFLTKAGNITSVDVAGKSVTVKDLATGKPLVIKLAADSQLKQLPDFQPMMGGMRQGGAAAGARPGGGGGDISQFLEYLPAAKLEELKTGDTIVVSSTKGATSDQVTAITLLANAGLLVQMASMQAGGQGAQRGAAMGMGMGGLSGAFGDMGMGGLDLPGMIP